MNTGPETPREPRLLEEAAQICPLPGLASWAADMAGTGVTIVAWSQSLGQLDTGRD